MLDLRGNLSDNFSENREKINLLNIRSKIWRQSQNNKAGKQNTDNATSPFYFCHL